VKWEKIKLLCAIQKINIIKSRTYRQIGKLKARVKLNNLKNSALSVRNRIYRTEYGTKSTNWGVGFVKIGLAFSSVSLQGTLY
jgi:hypothetical protein